MTADQKISELTELAVAPATNDVLPIVDTDAAATKKIAVSNLFTSPTFVTPALGTPASGVMTNVTGTAASLTAGLATDTVTKTGTGSTYATNTSPTFVTPALGTPASGTLTNCGGTAASLTAGLATDTVTKTGTGSTYATNTSPTFVTPVLGTPSSGTLTSCTGLPEAGLTLADNTTANASTTAHGFLKKLDNTATNFMNGAGNWAAPGGSLVELADETIGADAATWDVEVTPTGYSALVIIGLDLGADGNRILLRPNNDATDGNYLDGYIRSDGTTLAHNAGIASAFTLNEYGGTENTGSCFMIITNPASSTLAKGVLEFNAMINGQPLSVGGGTWNNTAAITTLRILVNGGGNIDAVSRIIVWGLV